MLDQNTDRMWYVIGAVIVGAAIIFLVNSSFPQVFAAVGDTFTNKTDDISQTIDHINPNMNEHLLDSNLLRGVTYEDGYLNTDARNDIDGQISKPLGSVLNHSHHITSEKITIKPNRKYRLSSNNGAWFTRIVYYDASMNYLTASLLHPGGSEHITTSPSSATYVRISGDIRDSRTHQSSLAFTEVK